MKGNRIRLVTDRPMEAVEVHPPSRNSVEMAGVTVEYYPPSPAWLGRDCPHPAERASGLWNVDHVGKEYDPAYLDRLEALVEDRSG